MIRVKHIDNIKYHIHPRYANIGCNANTLININNNQLIPTIKEDDFEFVYLGIYGHYEYHRKYIIIYECYSGIDLQNSQIIEKNTINILTENIKKLERLLSNMGETINIIKNM